MLIAGTEISFKLMSFFGLVTIGAIVLFMMVACTNPGYIQGSQTDVGRRAGAYNPKDYQVNTERK